MEQITTDFYKCSINGFEENASKVSKNNKNVKKKKRQNMNYIIEAQTKL